MFKTRGCECKNGLHVDITRRNKMPVTVSCRPPLLFEVSSCPLISKSLSTPKGLTHYRWHGSRTLGSPCFLYHLHRSGQSVAERSCRTERSEIDRSRRRRAPKECDRRRVSKLQCPPARRMPESRTALDSDRGPGSARRLALEVQQHPAPPLFGLHHPDPIRTERTRTPASSMPGLLTPRH